MSPEKKRTAPYKATILLIAFSFLSHSMSGGITPGHPLTSRATLAAQSGFGVKAHLDLQSISMAKMAAQRLGPFMFSDKARDGQIHRLIGELNRLFSETGTDLSINRDIYERRCASAEGSYRYLIFNFEREGSPLPVEVWFIRAPGHFLPEGSAVPGALDKMADSRLLSARSSAAPGIWFVNKETAAAPPVLKGAPSRKAGNYYFNVPEPERQAAAAALGNFIRLPADSIAVSGMRGGMINDTYYCEAGGERYVIQRMRMRWDKYAIHNNLLAFEKAQDIALSSGALPEHWEKIVYLKRRGADGETLYFTDTAGDVWRAMKYIDGERFMSFAEVPEPERVEIARAMGKGIACFSRISGAIPLDELISAVPDFHNIRYHLDYLERILAGHTAALQLTPEPAPLVRMDRDIYAARRSDIDTLVNEIRNMAETLSAVPDVPWRASHNDTRISNFIFQKIDGDWRAVCLLDLDSLQFDHGLNDIADALRSSASLHGLEPRTPDELIVDRDILSGILEAFIEEFPELADGSGRQELLQMILYSHKQAHLKYAARFLADHLVGNKYFPIPPGGREDLNLYRARVQIMLLKELGSLYKSWSDGIPEGTDVRDTPAGGDLPDLLEMSLSAKAFIKTHVSEYEDAGLSTVCDAYAIEFARRCRAAGESAEVVFTRGHYIVLLKDRNMVVDVVPERGNLMIREYAETRRLEAVILPADSVEAGALYPDIELMEKDSSFASDRKKAVRLAEHILESDRAAAHVSPGDTPGGSLSRNVYYALLRSLGREHLMFSRLKSFERASIKGVPAAEYISTLLSQKGYKIRNASIIGSFLRFPEFDDIDIDIVVEGEQANVKLEEEITIVLEDGRKVPCEIHIIGEENARRDDEWYIRFVYRNAVTVIGEDIFTWEPSEDVFRYVVTRSMASAPEIKDPRKRLHRIIGANLRAYTLYDEEKYFEAARGHWLELEKMTAASSPRANFGYGPNRAHPDPGMAPVGSLPSEKPSEAFSGPGSAVSISPSPQHGPTERYKRYSRVSGNRFIDLLEKDLERDLTGAEREKARRFVERMYDVRADVSVVENLNEMLRGGTHSNVCIKACSQARDIIDREFPGISYALVQKSEFYDSRAVKHDFYPYDDRLWNIWWDEIDRFSPYHEFLIIDFLGVPLVVELSGDQFVMSSPEPGKKWENTPFEDVGLIIVPVSDLRAGDLPYAGAVCRVEDREISELSGYNPNLIRLITGREPGSNFGHQASLSAVTGFADFYPRLGRDNSQILPKSREAYVTVDLSERIDPGRIRLMLHSGDPDSSKAWQNTVAEHVEDHGQSHRFKVTVPHSDSVYTLRVFDGEKWNWMGWDIRVMERASPEVPAGKRAKDVSATSSLEKAKKEALKIHEENLKNVPLIPVNTMRIGVIADSILPYSQRRLLSGIETDMRHRSYDREKLVRLEHDSSADFVRQVRGKIQMVLGQYDAKDRARISFEFGIACPDTDKVKAILESGLEKDLNIKIKAMAFEPCRDPVQVEGIMLALRALHSESITALRAAFEFLSGRELSPEELAIKDIDTFLKQVPFILPAIKQFSHENTLRLNYILRKYIKTAA